MTPEPIVMVEVFEAGMLIAFSVSWYCSIWKMLATGVATGKSLGFVLLICGGYLLGIASKLFVFAETGILPGITFLYAWNFVVTAFDAWLVWKLSKRQQPGQGSWTQRDDRGRPLPPVQS